MRFLLAMLLFFSTAVVYGEQNAPKEETPFAYDDHGKRDPFWRLVSPSGAVLNYDSDLQLSDMALDGIISDPNGQSMAIINSVIVKTSDKIGLYVVTEVEKDKVILTKGAEVYVLKLKKEE